MMAFFDELASLCAREVTQALKDKDIDRASGVIADLSTMLGRSIARVAGGDSAAIDRLMTAAENHVAAEASGFAAILNLQHLVKDRRNGKK